MAKRSRKRVETFVHEEASRRNIPTAEHEPVMAEGDRSPIEVAYERRNRDLDPQLVWRGKDERNRSDLVEQAPPLFIQERVHPKALINDLLPDLVAAAREAADAGFDVIVTCAFNYEAHASDFRRLGRVPVLKARMNADLHMAGDLKNTGKGNLFVVFGEPDMDILPVESGEGEEERFQVRINGVDVFHPNSGEIHSDGADGIACWFVDTDYNEESFFVRHAYFLGAGDPYKALKTTLKAEINQEAWATLKSNISRPFDRPSSGRIAVKVINHLGDEVMKVFRV